MDSFTNNKQQVVNDEIHELAEVFVHVREEHEHDMQLTKFHITPLSNEEIVLLIAEAKGLLARWRTCKRNIRRSLPNAARL